MYVKSAGKYVFLFPVGVEKEIKAEKVRFPYNFLPLILYVLLFTHMSVHADVKQVLIVLGTALIYMLLEDRKSKMFLISFILGFAIILGLDYIVAITYGVLGGFIFGSEVYIDEEWHVYLKPA